MESHGYEELEEAFLLSSAAVAKRFSMLLFTLHALLIRRVSTLTLCSVKPE